MSKLIDLTGNIYGRLVVLEKAESYHTGSHHSYFWLCQCDCGNRVKIKGEHLRGGTKSCGCYALETRKSGTHHLSNTRLFSLWTSIKTRCYNPNCRSYKNYGARNIHMCDEWLNSFKSFYDWALDNGYTETMSIDRINVDDDYSPTNCRWIPLKEQARNKRNNHWIEINGERKLLVDWCKQYNIRPSLVLNRINRDGWSEEKAITTPIRKKYDKS